MRVLNNDDRWLLIKRLGSTLLIFDQPSPVNNGFLSTLPPFRSSCNHSLPAARRSWDRSRCTPHRSNKETHPSPRAVRPARCIPSSVVRSQYPPKILAQRSPRPAAIAGGSAAH